jgi:hypothetical protein
MAGSKILKFPTPPLGPPPLYIIKRGELDGKICGRGNMHGLGNAIKIDW